MDFSHNNIIIIIMLSAQTHIRYNYMCGRRDLLGTNLIFSLNYILLLLLQGRL